MKKAIARMAREELECAARVLRDGGDPDKAIHEARKSVKKTRALLRLVKGSNLNAPLREIGRSLSDFRDSAVLVETLDSLGGPKVAAIRRELVRRRKAPSSETLREIAATLQERAAEVKEWPLKKDGLEKAAGKAKKARERAEESGKADDLHEWRKRVKDQWYHVRAFGGKDEKKLKELQQLLGRHHDLEVLRAAAPTLSKRIDGAQKKLADEAFKLTAQM
jgi:CHAD domain-containing protein